MSKQAKWWSAQNYKAKMLEPRFKTELFGHSTLWQPRWVGCEEGLVQEGGDTCMPMVDSCWCTTETNTIS